LPVLYSVDQRRILFYKTLKHHSSILAREIANLHDVATEVSSATEVFLAHTGAIQIRLLFLLLLT